MSVLKRNYFLILRRRLVSQIGGVVILLGLGACNSGEVNRDPSLQPLQENGLLLTAGLASPALPLDPDDPLWSQGTEAQMTFYPQQAVWPVAPGSTVSARVQSLYNGRQFALRIVWRDDEPATSRDVGVFADAVAVALPLSYGPGVELPFLGMGDARNPVGIWYWDATGDTQTLVANGFGTLESSPSDGIEAKGGWQDGEWRVVFRRNIALDPARVTDQHIQLAPKTKGLVPISFALWNGEEDQRSGNKLISRWGFLHFMSGKVDPQYVKEVTWSPPIEGDATRGKELMKELACDKCHVYPANPQPPNQGPDLTFIGGMHHPSYLLDSLRLPSKVIVVSKGFYAYAHGRGSGRALEIPIVSDMPSYEESARERDYYDMVEFLRTLR